MSLAPIETKSLKLVPKTRAETLAYLDRLLPEERAQVSPLWLALLERSGECSPWVHGFSMVEQGSGAVVGHAGFKGPPSAEGAVEIAYGVEPAHEGKGFATEAAAALARFALADEQVQVVLAHTLPELNASGRVLTKCGFARVGEVIDPEDGLVWRWEKRREAG